MLDLQHNVVSLLYSIKGMVEVYLGRIETSHFDPGQDALSHAQITMQKIQAQADRALAVTQRIGMAMKAAGPGETKSLGTISIREIWQEAIGMLRVKHCLDGIDIIEHIPTDFSDIRCEAMELLEIMYCLADNAIQSLAAGSTEKQEKGRLILRAQLGLSVEGRMLTHISVSDTGSGIPSETLVRLFEPFVTTKPAGEGNGLGLCLVKGLVRKNGGQISVTSFHGCGTTFILTFPNG